MKKEDIMELIPEISEEAAEEILRLHEQEVSPLSAEIERLTELSESEESIRQEAYEQGMAEAEQKFAQTELTRMLEAELEVANPKSTAALRALLDLEKISMEDGKLCGFSEQLEEIKKECPFLFEDDKNKPRFTSGYAAGEGGVDITRLSYKERLKLYREMPELYHQLVK